MNAGYYVFTYDYSSIRQINLHSNLNADSNWKWMYNWLWKCYFGPFTTYNYLWWVHSYSCTHPNYCTLHDFWSINLSFHFDRSYAYIPLTNFLYNPLTPFFFFSSKKGFFPFPKQPFLSQTKSLLPFQESSSCNTLYHWSTRLLAWKNPAVCQ